MNVLVTGATRNSAMAVVRSLAGSAHSVYGVDDRSLPFNSSSVFLESYDCIEDNDPDAYIARLIELIIQHQIDVLLPYTQASLIARHKQTLEQHTRLLIPAHSTFLEAFDNGNTMRACRRFGVGCPELYTEIGALNRLNHPRARQDRLWVVAKPRLDVGAATGVRVLKSGDDLRRYTKEYASLDGDFILQEYIPGPPENMRTVLVLLDNAHRVTAYFTTRKLRQWPLRGGVTALSESTHSPQLLEFVRPFFEGVGWQGFAEAEIKMDARDGLPKLIEINPRFCGYMGFPANCGLNFPDLICQVASQQAIGKTDYSAGTIYINWAAYLQSALLELRQSPQKGQTAAKILGELRQPKVSNGLAMADWRVILAKMLHEAKVLGS